MAWYSTTVRPAVLAFVLLLACGRGEPDPHQQRRPVVTVAAPDAVPIVRDTVGIPACDAYLDDFGRCIRKMDKAAQPAARRALDGLRRSWVASSRSPDGRAALAHACPMATEAARAATAGIGC